MLALFRILSRIFGLIVRSGQSLNTAAAYVGLFAIAIAAPGLTMALQKIERRFAIADIPNVPDLSTRWKCVVLRRGVAMVQVVSSVVPHRLRRAGASTTIFLVVLVAAASFAGFTSAGAQAAAGRAARKPAPTKVSIGISTATPSQITPIVAQNAGLFKKYGIDATITVVPSTQLLASVGAGKVDVGVFESPQPEEGIASGAPIRWLALFANAALQQLVVGPGITTISQLAGKSVGVTAPGSTTDIFAKLALQSADVPLSSVHFVPLESAPALKAAFAAGSIDAAALAPPSSQQVIASRPGSSSLLNFKNAHYKWNYAGLVGYMPWVKKHSAATVALLEALTKANAVFKSNEKAANAALQSVEPTVSSTIVAQGYQPTVPIMLKSLVPSLRVERFVLGTIKSLYGTQYGKMNPAKPQNYIDTTYATEANALLNPKKTKAARQGKKG